MPPFVKGAARSARGFCESASTHQKGSLYVSLLKPLILISSSFITHHSALRLKTPTSLPVLALRCALLTPA